MRPPRTRSRSWALAALLAALLHASCGGGSSPSPPPSSPAPPPGATVVTGRERIAWTYPGDATLVTFRAYVNGTPADLSSVTCTDGADGAECVSPLPPLVNGVHTIVIAAVTPIGIESDPSESITVQMVGVRSVAGAASGALVAAALPAAPIVEPLLADLPGPVELTSMPDGRVLVAQGDGRLRAFDPSAPSRVIEALDPGTFFDPAPAGAVSIAAAQDSPGQVFVSYVTRRGDGEQRLSVVRMRDVDGRLGEPAAIVDTPIAPIEAGSGVAAETTRPAPRSVVGPDGLLYVLLPPGHRFDGLPAASVPWPAVLRVATDGRAPSVAPPRVDVTTPPLALGWWPSTGGLWLLADSGDRRGARIHSDRTAEGDAVTSSGRTLADLALVADEGARRLRVGAADVDAWTALVGDAAALSGARGAARFQVPLDVTAVAPGLPGLVDDVIYADGIAYAAVRRAGSATSTVVRVTWRRAF